MLNKPITKEAYIKHLTSKGYQLCGDNQVTLGTLRFEFHTRKYNTAMGEQTSFCLKLSPKSDCSLPGARLWEGSADEYRN